MKELMRELLFKEDARNSLKKGVEILAEAVSSTLGPKGRCVLIEGRNMYPSVTKDGVTVAKSIFLRDPYQNMGAQMLKEVASKTGDNAGDGTTTATVLANSMIDIGSKYVSKGANPVSLKRGIDKAVKIVVDDIKQMSIPVGDSYDKIRQIATISANNDEEIGSLIMDAVMKVGNDGIITIEESNSVETYIEKIDGFKIQKGYISPHLVTDKNKAVATYKNPLILVTDNNISSMNDILPALEISSKRSMPLVIIADDISGEALATIIVNKVRNNFPVVAIKAPGHGDIKKERLEDIAVATGATVVTSSVGLKLENLAPEALGSADSITITKDSTTIVNGHGEKESVDGRIEYIKSQIDLSEIEPEKKVLKSRLSTLADGVAVIYVGAITDVEMKEKKDRVDDALCATRAAIEEGIVPGGGTALVKILASIQGVEYADEDETIGFGIAMKALSSPLKKISENSGVNQDEIFKKVHDSTDFSWGYNAKTDSFEDLIESGVIDPAKVTRVALENAASVAGVYLTTEAAIVFSYEQ